MNIGTGDLLTDATLVLAPTKRYGLVGRNGAGKSTLLRYICLAHLTPTPLAPSLPYPLKSSLLTPLS